MANVNIDYQQVQSTASQLNSGKEEIQAQLSRLMGQVNSLVGSGFATDQASEKFRASYSQWNSGAKNMMEGLEGMRSFLNQVVSQHQSLDQTLSQKTGG